MNFLTKQELKTTSHMEFIEAITRRDDTIIDMIISENTSYIKSFLSARYEVDNEFNKTGSERDQVLLKILKALVIYDIYSSHNPQQMTEVIKDNRDQAEAWLKAVRKGDVNPDLEKPSDEDSPKNYIQYGSNTKRTQHY